MPINYLTLNMRERERERERERQVKDWSRVDRI